MLLVLTVTQCDGHLSAGVLVQAGCSQASLTTVGLSCTRLGGLPGELLALSITSIHLQEGGLPSDLRHEGHVPQPPRKPTFRCMDGSGPQGHRSAGAAR